MNVLAALSDVNQVDWRGEIDAARGESFRIVALVSLGQLGSAVDRAGQYARVN